MNEKERKAAMDEWDSARKALAGAEEEFDDATDFGDENDEHDAHAHLCAAKAELARIEARFPECRRTQS